MRLAEHGTSTSKVEILNISPQGMWLYLKDQEYFLPYEEFPWLRNARLSEIQKVQLLHGHCLHWDTLDVDLDLDSLNHLDRHPLKYR